MQKIYTFIHKLANLSPFLSYLRDFIQLLKHKYTDLRKKRLKSGVSDIHTTF